MAVLPIFAFVSVPAHSRRVRGAQRRTPAQNVRLARRPGAAHAGADGQRGGGHAATLPASQSVNRKMAIFWHP